MTKEKPAPKFKALLALAMMTATAAASTPACAQSQTQDQAKDQAQDQAKDKPPVLTPGDKILAKSQGLEPPGEKKKPGVVVARANAILDKLNALTEKRGKKLPGLAEYYDTKDSLSQIDENAPEAPLARKLLAAMEKNERNYLKKVSGGDINADLAARADDIGARQKFAADTSKQMLRRGLSMTITTSGEKDTVLTYKYFRMDRTTVLNFAESGKVFNKARDLGFRSVVFTDGRLNWTYDVAANTFK
ncbi:MAG: hypothetical protein EKK40_02560 [Bradyrhizobiaceae bacterium]|nr:MAG: hypothetical protein EKK40_02560 [Bradyrhizobiaceae bacterium]